MATSPRDSPFEQSQLLKRELRRMGIQDPRVLQAIVSVPREEFVSKELRKVAYRNKPLPIELGQTISQPLVVAHMAEALQLQPRDRVLEVGTGSGYAAAIFSRLCHKVFTIERHLPLAQTAAARLKRLGYLNVRVLQGDGTLGWAEQAPFNAIVVAASGPRVPPALLEQLQLGGHLVIPIGDNAESQQLIRVTRQTETEFTSEDLGGVRFVPLVGHSGWPAEPEE